MPDRRRSRKGEKKLSLLKSQSRKATEVVPQNKAPLRPAESSPYKQAVELVERAFPDAAQVLIITTLPRGSLQIAQPARVPENLFKAYAREFHLEDRLTWRALLTGKPVSIASGPQVADARYVKEFLNANGLGRAAAAPLAQPILEGYPGAVHVYKAADQP